MSVSPNCPYSIDQIRAAFERTVEFFRNNPDAHLRTEMSNGSNGTPFDEDATCWCFGGRVAKELGPLPNISNPERYAPGYNELDSIGPNLAMSIYSINDNYLNPLDHVIEFERELFTEIGVLS